MKNYSSEFLTRRDVCDLFKVSLSTVIRLEESGKLPRVNVGLVRSPRYRRADVEKLVQVGEQA